jgi:peptidyl-prolyl cis-trans isomerase A (cyclophilin A)
MPDSRFGHFSVRTHIMVAGQTSSGGSQTDGRNRYHGRQADLHALSGQGADRRKDWTSPVTHAKKHGVPLYDGTIFHRVIPNFMIQGGDPMGTGTGDPGYAFKNETSPDLKFDRPGRLAYANSGPDTNGSQFFITEIAYASLNGNYTIFGQCDEASVTLVKQIARMGRDSNDRPYKTVKINHITVSGAK